MDGAAKTIPQDREAQRTWTWWGQEERCEKCQGQSPGPSDSRHGFSITGEIVRNTNSQAPTLDLLAQNPNFYKIPQVIHMLAAISAALSRTASLAVWNEESLSADCDPVFTSQNRRDLSEECFSLNSSLNMCLWQGCSGVMTFI